jgi:hypothetical protein
MTHDRGLTEVRMTLNQYALTVILSVLAGVLISFAYAFGVR